ncbi:MAG: hypothetical protein HUU03_13610 [Planctomycetaceae bacterium]|nr:hypothetical protein [Planctomycetaceae bacterium]
MHISRFSNPVMHNAIFGGLTPCTVCKLDDGFQLEVVNGIGRFTNSPGRRTTVQLEPDTSGKPLTLWLARPSIGPNARREVDLKDVGLCLTFTLTSSDYEQ